MRALAVTRVAALVADVLSLPINHLYRLQPVGRYPAADARILKETCHGLSYEVAAQRRQGPAAAGALSSASKDSSAHGSGGVRLDGRVATVGQLQGLLDNGRATWPAVHTSRGLPPWVCTATAARTTLLPAGRHHVGQRGRCGWRHLARRRSNEPSGRAIAANAAASIHSHAAVGPRHGRLGRAGFGSQPAG